MTENHETVGGQSMGPSTDWQNRPVIDPTKNVLDLVASAIQRQDDLRTMAFEHQRELDRLRDAHFKDLREAETARIDAIRAVDVGAVNRAAEVAATQATTLASQVAISAETLRTQVAAAASAATVALAAALEPVQKDIADLRRAQYEAQGQKTQVVESRSNMSAIVGLVGLGLVVLAFVGYKAVNPTTPTVVIPTPAVTVPTPAP